MNQNQSNKINPLHRDQMDENIFNELNIRYRVCSKFVPKSDNKDYCVCNRPESIEHRQDQDSRDAKWDMRHNTDEKINPAHGKFPNGALFTQLALDTPEAKVERILTDFWRIPPPRLIMSIIGGTKYFKLTDRLESNFINGIINGALNSDAWMITNGYNVGIVQLVGQAINKIRLTQPKKRITAIALCKWGSVKDVEMLTDPYYKRKKSVMDRSMMPTNDEKKKERESGQRDLDMNHSHYLMLDDGRLRFYDTGDYRTKLCVHLAKLQHESDFPIPTVTIVVEGGKDTIANMYYDLHANIPVVIIDGSGRVADFFKRWLLYTKQFDDLSEDSEFAYEIDEIDRVMPVTTLPLPNGNRDNTFGSNPPTSVQLYLTKHRKTLREMFVKYSDQLRKDLEGLISNDDDPYKRRRKKQSNGDDRSKKIDRIFDQVMYCLQPAVRAGITVFDLDSDDNLSETIFRSICRSRQKYFENKENDQNIAVERNQQRVKPPPTLKTIERHKSSREIINKKDQDAQRSQLLELAMDWDCIDVAKALILQNSLDNILNREQAFLDALRKNLPTFVYEFLKLGIDPSEIFFPDGEFIRGRYRYRKFLRYMYTDEAVNSDKTNLGSFIEAEGNPPRKHVQTTDNLNAILRILIGDYMYKLYFDEHEDEKRYQILSGLEENPRHEQNQINIHVLDLPDYTIDHQTKQTIRDYVMRDLFLWAILMNRIEMAKVFLSHTKYRICSALIATKILKEYHQKATHGDLKDNYIQSANYFQNYAIECINQCEKNDANEAFCIVLQRIQLYGYVSCLQVAANARDKLFIATSCCVQAMNNIWFDKIHPEQSRKRNEFAMGVGILSLGVVAPIALNYRQDIGDSKDQRLTRSLQPYGIDYSDPYPLAHPRIMKTTLINTYLHRLKNFHQAPRTKYYYHCITYCFFLLLFSYVMLFDFQPPTDKIPSIRWTEFLTIIFVSFMLIEEINYFMSHGSLTLLGRCKSYFRNLFKFLTLLGLVLFYIGLILRFTYADTEDNFTAARVIMAFDLEIWWLRSLAFIIVVPFLGPHLVAIGKMLKDLLFFMCIIAIVMTGYGVASRSMVYYYNPDKFNDTEIDTSFSGRSIFRQIAFPVYYLLYGELGNELGNLNEYPDAGWSISTHVLLAFHMLFVNILLTNLLIAMFSKRFDQVYDDTKNIWHSQQYLFTREYFMRSPFFPPISFFWDVYQLCRLTFFYFRRIIFKKPADRQTNVFKMIPINRETIKEWYEFEGASTYEYAHAEVRAAKIACATTNIKSNLRTNEKREETNENTYDSSNSSATIRQVQDDLAKLTQSLGEVKGDLKVLLEIQRASVTSQKK